MREERDVQWHLLSVPLRSKGPTCSPTTSNSDKVALAFHVVGQGYILWRVALCLPPGSFLRSKTCAVLVMRRERLYQIVHA